MFLMAFFVLRRVFYFPRSLQLSMFPPLLFAFLAAALWASADLFSKRAVAKVEPVLAVFWAQLFGVLPFVALFALSPSAFPVTLFWPVALAGLLASLGYVYFFKGLNLERVSLVQPLINTDGLVAAAISMLFLSEAITSLKVAALLLAVSGVLLATFSLERMRRREVIFSRGSLYGLVSSFSFGLSLVITKLLLASISPLSAVVFYDAFIVVFLFVYLVAVRKFSLISFSQVAVLFPSGVLDTAAFGCFYLALLSLPSSIVSPLATTGAVVVLVVLSKFFLKERLSTQEKIGVALIVLAIALLSLESA